MPITMQTAICWYEQNGRTLSFYVTLRLPDNHSSGQRRRIYEYVVVQMGALNLYPEVSTDQSCYKSEGSRNDAIR